jgi:membrane protein implicated in regulation of membrane protease activity
MDIYDIFFSICLGFFIGGLIFSIISVFLAQMESQSLGQEIDTDVDIDAEIDIDADVDVDVDIDVDAEVDVDIDADVDVDLDAEVEVDIDAEVDIDIDSDIDVDTDVIGTTTSPAPIMLLISAFLLVFGITGISLYYVITIEWLKFLMFIFAPIIGFLVSKYLNVAWKKIAKSQYYKISPTQNLIGKKGEVVFPINERGGVIRIVSTTPMKYEKMHVMPYDDTSYFDRGTNVYIIGVRNNKIIVDSNKELIKKMR